VTCVLWKGGGTGGPVAMAGSGALVPLKGGASPTMRSPAGSLLAVVPTIDHADDFDCPSCQAQLRACAAIADGPDRLAYRRQPLDEVSATPRAAERRA
jgi:hypothetical protein